MARGGPFRQADIAYTITYQLKLRGLYILCEYGTWKHSTVDTFMRTARKDVIRNSENSAASGIMVCWKIGDVYREYTMAARRKYPTIDIPCRENPMVSAYARTLCREFWKIRWRRSPSTGERREYDCAPIAWGVGALLLACVLVCSFFFRVNSTEQWMHLLKRIRKKKKNCVPYAWKWKLYMLLQSVTFLYAYFLRICFIWSVS